VSNQTKVISNFVVIEGSTTWSASVNYDAGPQPLDSNNSNFGSPLADGSLSASTSITGYLLRYAGAIQTIPANGVALRAAMRATAVLNTANSFQITTGTTYKYLIVAIPAYKTFVSAQNLGTNEALTFVLSTTITTIPDAAGTPKAYKVYICTNAVPFPQDYTIQITLS
jgi:hypothetical protein